MIYVDPTATYPTLKYIDFTVNVWVESVSISFAVNYFNDIDILMDTRTVFIDGQEYADWGEDDQYIIDVILDHLNLTETV